MQERLGSRIGACQQGLTMPTGLGGCSLAQPRRKVEGPSSCTTGALSPADSSRHAGGAQSEWPSAARAAAAAAKQAGCGSGLSKWSRNSCATRGKRRLKTAKQSAQEAQKAGTELRTAKARPRPPRDRGNWASHGHVAAGSKVERADNTAESWSCAYSAVVAGASMRSK